MPCGWLPEAAEIGDQHVQHVVYRHQVPPELPPPLTAIEVRLAVHLQGVQVTWFQHNVSSFIRAIYHDPATIAS